MATGLRIWGLIAGIYAALMLSLVKSAVHEIEVGVALLIATVSFGCAGIIDAIEDATRERKARREEDQVIICDACGSQNRVGIEYCNGCGAKMERGEPATESGASKTSVG